jgi:Raf kinase inhibitor-like YbhB/YbcL family protein
MRLTSSAFRDGDEIPMKYTSDGMDVSPPLEWTGVPRQARSLALLVDDPDAPDPEAPNETPWVHWVVVDMPADRRGLHENIGRLAHGTIGLNDWNHVTWGGPSPPIGRHRYFFRLYALDKVLELERPTRQDVERAMGGHVLAEATLICTYKRRR